MGKYDKLAVQNKQKVALEKKAYEQAANNYNEISNDVNNTVNLYNSAWDELNDIDLQFKNATKLEMDDIAFLFFAVALQCFRQYVLTNFKERLGDQDAAKNTRGHNEEHSNRKRGDWFLPSPSEIICNPVPYDANRQINVSRGALVGNGKMGHRLVLGHDPILGWVFGTANIATSTLTTNKFDTYHIKTQNKMDYLSQPVPTLEMLEVAMKRFFSDGLEGAAILATSLAKEWIHLKSDVNTKNSLPLPVISVISPDMANLFAKYGLDMCNVLTVVKQATYAELINVVIGILHGMHCYFIKYPQREEQLSDGIALKHKENVINALELSKVRTKKIILLSNVIASTSNVLVVAGMEVAAYFTENPDLARRGLQSIDLGGYLVTLYRLISDIQFIRQVEKDYLENEWRNRVIGEKYSFMAEGEVENDIVQ